MKRTWILFLIILSFVFIPNINASKKCYYEAQEGYYKANGWKGTISKCKSDGKDCSYTSGKYRDFKAVLTVPTSTNANSRPKVSTTYLAWKSRTNETKVSTSDSCDVENWSQPVADTDLKGDEYVTSNSCPGFLIVREGVFSNNHSANAFIATGDTYTKIMEWILSSGKYSNQAFFFVAKKTKESDDKKNDDDDVSKYSSCKDFKTESGTNGCSNNPYYSCLWVKKTINGKDYEYCNFDDLTYVKCGDAWDIPSKLPGLISFLVNILKIATPIILILVSVLTLLKAVASSKEDDITKAKSSLIKKKLTLSL